MTKKTTKTVELLFHDATLPQFVYDVTDVIFTDSVVSMHREDGEIYSYPLVHVHRIKELQKQR